MLVVGSRQKLAKKGNSLTGLVLAWGIAVIMIVGVPSPGIFGAETHDLSPAEQAGQLREVRSTLDVRGRVLLEGGSTGLRELPMEVHGELAYDERVLESRGEPLRLRAVRHYHRAAAVLKIGTGQLRPQLSPERPLIVTRFAPEGALHFSPLGPLRSEDLDLLETQCDSLLLSWLLPTESVVLEQTWEIPTQPLALLLGIDVVNESTVVGRLVQVQGSTAELSIEGQAEGAVGGAATKVVLEGTATFDLQWRGVTRLKARLEEERDAGHAEPGLSVAADLMVSVRPLEASESLADERLAELSLEEHPGAALVRFRTASDRFQLLLDRRWTPMLDRHDLCVFKLVDRGAPVAQCNLSELPVRAGSEPMSLEAFQAEVQRTLGDQFGQIVAASQETSRAGNRVLRVLAQGSPAEVPIVWIYYHVSDRTGRRAALAFTLEEKQREAFADQDRGLVDSFEFLRPADSAEADRNAAGADPQ
jgi:hypothetical protein